MKRDSINIVSRVKISPAQLLAIKKQYGVSRVQQSIDRSISAGLRVQIGDRVIDYTTNNILSGSEVGHEYSVGHVTTIGDGVVRANGLSTAQSGEVVAFDNDVRGMVMNLEPTAVGIVVLGDSLNIQTGQQVHTTSQLLSVPVGDDLLGRVVDPLGIPLDGKGEIHYTATNPLERIAPGVMSREAVSVPLQTGIKAIDTMIPIGRGQRELIIGDRQTGKTAIALTTIVNQKDQNVQCIYVAIGQRQSSVASLVATLSELGAMDHTVVVAASASDSAALQYLSPYSGCAIAEYFLGKGEDALVVYDDLTKHAWAYRQMSLLLRRPSGREAYPGDIFYAHSRLLERSCRLNKENGGGSITALPIIETQAGDLSSYIPTNVISITDGQIYLESDLFNAGQRPAINVGNSVSRVGGTAQIKAMKQVAGKMRLDLAQYRELAAFAQFSSDLDEKTQAQLNRGAKVTELLKQGWDAPMPVWKQVISIWAGTRGFLDDLFASDISRFESHFLEYVARHKPKIFDEIREEKTLSEDLEKQLETLVREAKDVFTPMGESNGNH